MAKQSEEEAGGIGLEPGSPRSNSVISKCKMQSILQTCQFILNFYSLCDVR
jgi:hypothetical protein